MLTPDGKLAITVNQQTDSLSLVDLTAGVVLSEADCGERPTHLVLMPDGGSVLATAADSGELFRFFRLSNDRLEEVGRLNLGREPRGIAVSPDGKLAYVALSAAAAVAVVDLENWRLLDEISAGHWPRFLALAETDADWPSGAAATAVCPLWIRELREQLSLTRFGALNLGQMHVSADGTYVYFPWIVYRQFEITAGNIRRGWVLASRIARLRIDVEARREAISLDPQAAPSPILMAWP